MFYFLSIESGDMKAFAVIAASALILVLCVAWQRARGRRVKVLITRWAAEAGVAITSLEEAGFRRGPFKFSANSKNIVMKATVRGADGTMLTGWIRCRYSLTKPGEYTLTVKWDGQAQDIEHTDIDTDDPLVRAGIK